MRIYPDVKLQGERNEIIERGLIDTGAEISLMPLSIAAKIGAWRTNQQTNVVGIHGEGRTLPIIVAHLYFPSLNNIGGKFPFAMSNTEQELSVGMDIEQKLIVGMDILKPLGITIDTKTHQLSVKSEIWEAFKTLTTVGVLVYGGLKLLDALSEQND